MVIPSVVVFCLPSNIHQKFFCVLNTKFYHSILSHVLSKRWNWALLSFNLTHRTPPSTYVKSSTICAWPLDMPIIWLRIDRAALCLAFFLLGPEKIYFQIYHWPVHLGPFSFRDLPLKFVEVGLKIIKIVGGRLK